MTDSTDRDDRAEADQPQPDPEGAPQPVADAARSQHAAPRDRQIRRPGRDR